MHFTVNLDSKET